MATRMTKVQEQSPRRRTPGQRQRAYMRMRRRKRMQLLFCVVAFLVVLSIAVVLCLTVLFQIQSVQVEGTSRYPAQQIVQASGIATGDNLFLADVNGAAQKIRKTCPYLGSVRVRRRLPAKVVIQIAEAAPAGAVAYNGKYVLLDAAGRVLEISPQAPTGVPVVTGLPIRSAQVGSTVAYEGAQKSELFHQLAKAIHDTHFSGVTAMDVSEEYNLRVTCRTPDGGTLQVKLGNSTYLEKKFRFVKATASQHLQGAKGTFDVSSVGHEKSITWFTPDTASSAVSQAASASSLPAAGTPSSESEGEKASP